MSYQAILYDIDGTLLDTVKMNLIPLQKIIEEELHENRSYESLLPYMALPGLKTMEKLGISDIDKTYARWVKYVNEYPDPAMPYDGMEDVLHTLKHHFRQGVVTSKKKEQYVIDMPSSLNALMDIVVVEEDTTAHKPDPAPLLKAIKAMGLQPSEVLYVGDATSDYLCAQNAHCGFALALWSGLPHEGVDEPDMILHTPQDLLALLK